MPLTKGDKLIIIGAVVLALTVVAGLAAWRKPHLFSGKMPAPEMTQRDFTAPTPAPSPPPAPPGARTSASPPPAPPVVTTDTSPAAPVPLPISPPASPPVTPPASPHSPGPVEALSAPAPALLPPAGDSAPQVPQPPVSPEVVAKHPLFAGDAALDTMFSEMGDEAASPKPQAAQRPEAAPKAVSEPVETKAEALDVPNKPAPLASKKPVTDKPPAKTAASPASRGAVVAVSATDKPGEYVLTVTTSSPAGEVTRTYMDNPPRLVIDLVGRWTYTGPLTLSGKSPLISQVRVGKHPDRLRLVLDLAPDATTRLREAPIVDRTQNGVTIRLPK
ncbi:AMIN domain-containing protein [Desulfolutivibrio sulfoxidireducens]|uniref:AMIN domain-containing protein n=1 Tax=Desulfolutivibrio sulfoxidireducens TaxID=2773299 RepID=UPI00159E5FBE|nr:AMIN domain-containing protein [Desulfolutivibrio sulfoxidireducens]QLA14735.1 AMIN domain-containing protein [Desulfolutivibrio sulfoxidireducens]